MYAFERLRFRKTVQDIKIQLRDMALDAKAFPGVVSEVRLKSSASTPSLRSSVAEVVPMGRSTPVSEGGNVRVVVRVRGFLPRGKYDESCYLARINSLQRSSAAQNVSSR